MGVRGQSGEEARALDGNGPQTGNFMCLCVCVCVCVCVGMCACMTYIQTCAEQRGVMTWVKE